MKRDISMFVEKCPDCQQVKAEHVKRGAITKWIDIQTLKWEAINRDFVVGRPRTWRVHDSIWVFVDKMTKSAHFLRVKSTYSVDEDVKGISMR